jgi:hypothetical protein
MRRIMAVDLPAGEGKISFAEGSKDRVDLWGTDNSLVHTHLLDARFTDFNPKWLIKLFFRE